MPYLTLIRTYKVLSLFGKMSETRYNCPFCVLIGKPPDTKGHLYVNWSKGVYHCFRCGAKGRTTQLRDVPLTLYKHCVDVDRVALTDPRRFVKYTISEIELKYPQVFRFLQRKNAVSYFQQVYLTFASTGYGLVIPLQFDGRVSYQVRMFDCPTKYLSSPGFRKCDFPIGLDELVSPVAVLVEGYFDYLPLKGFAVCTFGKSVYRELPQMLRVMGVKSVVVLWDSDSHFDGLSDAVKLYKLGVPNSYAGFMIEGSPSDFKTMDLLRVTCVRVSTGDFFTLGEILEKGGEV